MFNKRHNDKFVENADQTGNVNGNGNGRQPARGRFTVGKWIRLHGLDILTMAAMGAIGLGVYRARPAPSRSFPIFNTNGGIAYPDFAYPLRHEIIPIWLAAFIAFIAPFVIFTLFQIRRRSIDDWLTTTLGLLKSLITAAVFQVFIKWLIGGLRPHFLAVCKPNITQGQFTGIGFAQVMYDRKVCTGDEKQINDSLESMPSGHSTAAWAGLFFLALYINAQLKVMSAHNPAYWKMIFMFMPILGAFLISGTLTIDAYHNWYDVLVGGIIGVCCALVAFRQTFAAILDFRFNHILLPRATSLFHRQPHLPMAGRGASYAYQPSSEFLSHDLPFTREGGWNHGGGAQHVGAPGDATVLLTGAGGGMGAGGLGGGMGAGNNGLGGGGMGMGTGNNGLGGGGLGTGHGIGTGVGNGTTTHTGPTLGHNGQHGAVNNGMTMPTAGTHNVV